MRAETHQYHNQQKYNNLFSQHFPLFVSQALKDASLVPWAKAPSKNDIWQQNYTICAGKLNLFAALLALYCQKNVRCNRMKKVKADYDRLIALENYHIMFCLNDLLTALPWAFGQIKINNFIFSNENVNFMWSVHWTVTKTWIPSPLKNFYLNITFYGTVKLVLSKIVLLHRKLITSVWVFNYLKPGGN